MKSPKKGNPICHCFTGIVILTCLASCWSVFAQNDRTQKTASSRISKIIETKSAVRNVDFERHVAPLLGRYGCNSAACHGAFDGKGDLQLSLFGYSSKMDFNNLLDRIDTDDPTESLLLQKPSGEEEHGGGIRFTSTSTAYKVIENWIAQGARWKPGSGYVKKIYVEPSQILFKNFDTKTNSSTPRRSLKVIAEFADGSEEDVTSLSRFSSRDEGVAKVNSSGSVSAVRNGDTFIIVSYRNSFAAIGTMVPHIRLQKARTPNSNRPSNRIDRLIGEKLFKLNIQPSPQSSDSEFLRRLTLDTIGTIPTPEEVVNFCKDKSSCKREKKIDELLTHPMHAALWATRMCDITKCDVEAMGEDENVRIHRAQMWHDWFRKRFAENTSYAEIARGVLTATSRQKKSVSDWIKSEEEIIRQTSQSFESDYAKRDTLDLYWRRNTDNGKFPLKQMSELTSVAFTGVRLNCAQCHKHPFDRWTQNDYAAFANIFSRVTYGSSTELNNGIFAELDARRLTKRQGKKTKPLPRLREVFLSELHAREIAGAERGSHVAPRAFDSLEFDTKKDLRQQFFEWLIERNNPYFARSFVNRTWAIYFGIGFVNPVDDFSIANPPSHPELLDALAVSFRDSKFDIRKLEKQILMSDTYQRTSSPNETNHDDKHNFARQYLRLLLAEVAVDTIDKALGTTQDFGKFAPKDSLAIEVGSNKIGGKSGRALQIFGRGERGSICDCDRRNENDLRQYIFLVNDKSIHHKIQTGSIRKLLDFTNEKMISDLYLRFLGRRPSEYEKQIGLKHLAKSKSRETAFDDLVWALLNTREFLINH